MLTLLEKIGLFLQVITFPEWKSFKFLNRHTKNCSERIWRKVMLQQINKQKTGRDEDPVLHS